MSTTTSEHEGTADTAQEHTAQEHTAQEHTAQEHTAQEHTAQEHTAQADSEHSEHDHPSDWAYVKIALILGAITAVEVFTYFDTVFSWGSFLIPSLLFMMVVKFWLVATWFMHLKFDNPIFSKMFVGGLLLAVGVYVAALAAFEFWA